MKEYPSCTCCIVPPYIMDLPEFSDYFKHTRDFTQKVEENRKDISYQVMGAMLVMAPMGSANRMIYDAQHTSVNSYQLVRNEGGPLAQDAAANSVYENCGKVRDFYKNVYNYLSVDGNGRDLIMNIHFQEDLNNAMWSSKVSAMFFGDGNGQILRNLTGPIDVIAHEMTHGVVQYTAGLIYQGQSGALNEHLADVFGTVIKQYYGGPVNWLIGEDVVGPAFKPAAGFPVAALRSLKDPGQAFAGDTQPDHMSKIYTGSGDYGGVHINSGILNKVFYLVTSGIAGPAPATGAGGTSASPAVNSLPGLGIKDAGQLWFNALRAINVDTCDFEGFAKIVLSSCLSMISKNTLPASSDTLVKAAFDAVGISI